MIGKRSKQFWQKGQLCEIRIKGQLVRGKLIEQRGPKWVVVNIETQKKYLVDPKLITQLAPALLANSERLSQYSVNWDPVKVNYAFQANGVRFNGWWRKRAFNSFAVDLFVIAGEIPSILADCITYDNDPRENMASLNADICAAANKWLHFNEVKDSTTIGKLKQRADSPIVTIKRLGTIDGLILKLKEFRDVAIRCGGTRHFTFASDEPTDPKVSIKVNFTDQAMVLDGKVPSLYAGAMIDGVKTGKRGEARMSKLDLKPTQENLDAMIAQLKAAKKRGDEVEQRKIRAALRKMGHKGGGKSVKHKEKK